MKFIIHGRLPGMNEYTNACRKNKFAGNKMKQEAEMLIIYSLKSQLRNVHIDNKVKLNYTFYEPNQRRDLDNISGFAHKVIQDSLVKSNVIDNDGWNNIVGFTDTFYVDKKNPRIVVELEEK